MEVELDASGLVPAIVQDRLTGQVRMLAYMSRESLAATLRTGKATFYSRSRRKLWEKGAESGHALHVRSIHADCDGDTLLLLVDPAGPSCHTGSPSCFFRGVAGDGELSELPEDATTFLERLERGHPRAQARRAGHRELHPDLARRRRKSASRPSCARRPTSSARAMAGESDKRVAAEAADVLYHVMVALSARGVPLRAVLDMLAARSSRSGHQEKQSRR